MTYIIPELLIDNLTLTMKVIITTQVKWITQLRNIPTYGTYKTTKPKLKKRKDGLHPLDVTETYYLSCNIIDQLYFRLILDSFRTFRYKSIWYSRQRLEGCVCS